MGSDVQVFRINSLPLTNSLTPVTEEQRQERRETKTERKKKEKKKNGRKLALPIQGELTQINEGEPRRAGKPGSYFNRMD